MNRRQFVSTAAAGAGAAAAALKGPSAFAAAPNGRAIHMVVADGRYAESLAFGDAARALGAPVRVIDGDLTALWFDELEPHFIAGGAPIAGVGTPRTLLCLEQLARGPGLRVLWRAEHRPRRWRRDSCTNAGVEVRHDLEGSRDVLARAEAALAAESDWEGALAPILLSSAARPDPAGERATLRTATPFRDRATGSTLASWVLAPRRPAAA